jgi:hypothetical protein
MRRMMLKAQGKQGEQKWTQTVRGVGVIVSMDSKFFRAKVSTEDDLSTKRRFNLSDVAEDDRSKLILDAKFAFVEGYMVHTGGQRANKIFFEFQEQVHAASIRQAEGSDSLPSDRGAETS